MADSSYPKLAGAVLALSLISRERHEAEHYAVGRRVGLRFRRWKVYPAAASA